MTTRFGKAMKAGLCAVVLAAASVAIGLDAGPAHAVTTSIIIGMASPDPQNPGQTVCTSSTAVVSTVAMMAGPPISLCVWAKDVTDPQGVGAFEVGFSYNGSLVTVQSVTPQTTWLGSTGRSVFCSATSINLGSPASAAVGCATINQPPPYGPQGMGLIGKVTVQPGTTPGLTTLTFPTNTFLQDTGYVQGTTVYSPQPIPANVGSPNIRVAACADYNGDQTIRMNDIGHIVQRYGTHDVPSDLDISGVVLSPDIVIGVMEYGRDCPT